MSTGTAQLILRGRGYTVRLGLYGWEAAPPGGLLALVLASDLIRLAERPQAPVLRKAVAR